MCVLECGERGELTPNYSSEHLRGEGACSRWTGPTLRAQQAQISERGVSGESRRMLSGLLRSPAGASSLATKAQTLVAKKGGPISGVPLSFTAQRSRILLVSLALLLRRLVLLPRNGLEINLDPTVLRAAIDVGVARHRVVRAGATG